MGGCTNCGAKAGCDHRKSDMFASIDAALVRLYPSRVWGQPDDDARFEAGIEEAEADALAEELAERLKASTLHRPCAEDEYCETIYILCLGREPGLLHLRDASASIPEELESGALIREQYLRVCLSTLGRFAGVQQVAVSAELSGDELYITEAPRAGVYDPPLLPRLQKLVGVLAERDILHLDFGEISAPPSGFDPADYAQRYGGAPAVANFLFYPQPATTVAYGIVKTSSPRLR